MTDQSRTFGMKLTLAKHLLLAALLAALLGMSVIQVNAAPIAQEGSCLAKYAEVEAKITAMVDA